MAKPLKRGKKKTGPKPIYNESVPDRAFELCLLGLRNKDLATAFGVDVQTIDSWISQKPRFAERVRAGRQEADAKVAKAWYHRAIGYSHEDTVILTNRITEYDDNGKPIRSYNEPLIVPTIKHYPPDGYSAQKWLSIRQRDRWAEIQKTEHHHKIEGHLDHTHLLEQITDTSQFSDEELKLAAKLGLSKARKTHSPELQNN